jgi:TolB-like protein/class 3 adenylate cyclase
MPQNRPPGKLAVILHADIVGSTGLMQKDEQIAHNRIQQTFRRFGSIITKYHGHVREIRGDALLAEFERASWAVAAGFAFQDGHKEYIANLDDSIRPAVRVGIAMGEVVIADNTISGAGVVLAQRLEQLAQPGGIVIQGAARETIPGRYPFDFRDLGQQDLKGFDNPIRAYAVELESGSGIPPPERTGTRSRNALVAVVMVAVVAAGALLLWSKPWEQRQDPGPKLQSALPLPDKPSIAVLPFTNMSDQAQQEYFADGITEDLITDLSKISGLFVIARNSVFTYKDKAIDISEVAAELGVRFILEGSVRRAGNKVRINAQLIDAATGGHLWAERYDGVLDDVFGLQDRVTNKIVSVLAVTLSGNDDGGTSQGTSNAGAYDEFLKGWNEYLKQTPENYVNAIALFNRAIELDPAYSRAYAALAATYWQSWTRLWHEEIGERRWHNARVKAENFLSRAMQDPSQLAFQLASAMSLQQGKIEQAISEAEKAIAMDPNDPEGYIALAGSLSHNGDAEQALVMVEQAMRLNPHYPPYYLYELGLAQFVAASYDDAITALKKAIVLNPADLWSQRLLLSTYGHLGRTDDAAEIIENLSRMHFFEALSVKTASFWHPFQQTEDAARFAEGLRKAGVPD